MIESSKLIIGKKYRILYKDTYEALDGIYLSIDILNQVVWFDVNTHIMKFDVSSQFFEGSKIQKNKIDLT